MRGVLVLVLLLLNACNAMMNTKVSSKLHSALPELTNAFYDFNAEDLRKTELDYATEWNRYSLLRQFLDYIPVSVTPSDAQYVVREDTSSHASSENIRMKYMGDVSWRIINLVCLIMLGWRARDNSIQLDTKLQPITWQSDPTRCMDQLFDFSDWQDQFIDYKLSCDLPEEEESTDLVCEALGGYEMFKLMSSCAESDVELRRKLLVVKWLYVYGFLSSEFPPVLRVIPYHQH